MKPVLLAALLGLACCATSPVPLQPPSPTSSLDVQASDATGDPAREQVLRVPVTGLDGTQAPILVRVCRPGTDAPGRLVVINHGTPVDAAERAKTRLGNCRSEAASWFLRRGYVVAFPLRRGYGATGGAYAESNGPCNRVDYDRAGLESARDIDAAVDAVAALPFVRPDHAVVVGQSAGGWGAIAYDSVPHPRVSAFVVMAGGRGGHLDGVPGRNCRPELLAAAAGQFGRTARTPSLWVYTANDSFFGPPVATALHDAFAAAGGEAEFVQPGPFKEDGHTLFFGRGGSLVWGPLVERFLRANG